MKTITYKRSDFNCESLRFQLSKITACLADIRAGENIFYFSSSGIQYSFQQELGLKSTYVRQIVGQDFVPTAPRNLVRMRWDGVSIAKPSKD